jgi:radical SAM superfamily enzyme YgiQ (UPF0313 family)
VRVLLIATYELGHQPLHVATPAAALLEAGHQVRCIDVSVDKLDPVAVDWADRAALSVPMHTAMRLASEVAATIRSRRPGLPLCFYGLYAHTGRGPFGRDGGVAVGDRADTMIAGEYLGGLLAWVGGNDAGPPVQLQRNPTLVPARHLLPPLDRYTRLSVGGDERLVASVEATRGCSHRCRHCPVPVVYDGRVRTVDEAALLVDLDHVVDMGARHVTFSDPDFLNMPGRARRLVAAVHARHPGLTFDLTTKVEHLLRDRDVLPELAQAGCLFVVSAFESTNDTILGYLAKGHTVAEASEAVRLLRHSGIEVRPSWMPFTPWTTGTDLVDLVDFVIAHDLVDNVDPVQYTIRLLVPDRSLLLGTPAMMPYLGPYDEERLGWSWRHPDPAIDELQGAMAALVEQSVGRRSSDTFADIDAMVRSGTRTGSGRPEPASLSCGPAGERPKLSEPWFCCSEPTERQLAPLGQLGG